MTPCTWTLDTSDWGDSHYETGCGEAFCFFDGTPEDNKIRFCPYCGRALEVVEPAIEPDEDDNA